MLRSKFKKTMITTKHTSWGRPANRMLILDSHPEWVPRLEAICLISHSEKLPILRSLKTNAYQHEWPQLRAGASRTWLLFLALMFLLKSSRQVTLPHSLPIWKKDKPFRCLLFLLISLGSLRYLGILSEVSSVTETNKMPGWLTLDSLMFQEFE